MNAENIQKEEATSSSKPILRYCRITSEAIPPRRLYPSAAGYDLFSAHELWIQPKCHGVVFTDLRIGLPKEFKHIDINSNFYTLTNYLKFFTF